MKTKEEVIKEAYCELFDKLPAEHKEEALKNNGFVTKYKYNYFYKNIEINNRSILDIEDFFEYKTLHQGYLVLVRPKSLQGIENDNGWIEGIPSENGFYFIEYINKSSDIKRFEDNLECINWFKLNVKKYQKIYFPKQSIY